MLSKRRLAKPALVLVALAGLAVALSACSVYKLGSLQVSQPGGIGSVRVHFLICTNPEPPVEGGETTCSPSDNGGQWQSIIGVAVPKGSSAPATITATPLKGGSPIVFSRNDQAAQSMSEGTAALAAMGEGEAWPPPGTEGVGYLSAPYTEEEGALREWSVDADFGLPAAADGGSFGGPFAATVAYGLRAVGGEGGPAERPVDCTTGPGDITAESAYCLKAEGAQIGTSDLKIVPPPLRGFAYLGGKGALSFLLDFASTATVPPSFGLKATTTLPKAKAKLGSSIFTPDPPPPGTTRSPGPASVTVTVPKNAKPGVYDVTLTATSPQGSSVSQVAKLKVAKAKIKLGGVKLNKAKGTAILSVKVPAAGTLTVSGKGFVKKKAKAKKAKRLKILVKPNAKTKILLAAEGQAKVKAKIAFRPTGAAAAVKSKSIVLKQS